MTDRPSKNPSTTRAPHCVSLSAAGQSLRRRRRSYSPGAASLALLHGLRRTLRLGGISRPVNWQHEADSCTLTLCSCKSPLAARSSYPAPRAMSPQGASHPSMQPCNSMHLGHTRHSNSSSCNNTLCRHRGPHALENGYPHTTAVHRRAPDVDHPPAPRPAELAQERPVGFAPRVEAHPGHVSLVHQQCSIVFLRLLFV
jgi:hypothetical protein